MASLLSFCFTANAPVKGLFGDYFLTYLNCLLAFLALIRPSVSFLLLGVAPNILLLNVIFGM